MTVLSPKHLCTGLNQRSPSPIAVFITEGRIVKRFVVVPRKRVYRMSSRCRKQPLEAIRSFVARTLAVPKLRGSGDKGLVRTRLVFKESRGGQVYLSNILHISTLGTSSITPTTLCLLRHGCCIHRHEHPFL